MYQSGVVRLDDIQQEALLGDAHLLEGLVKIAGVEGGTVEVHDAASVVDLILFQNRAEGGGLIDEDGFALDVIAYSNLNHIVSP